MLNLTPNAAGRAALMPSPFDYSYLNTCHPLLKELYLEYSRGDLFRDFNIEKANLFITCLCEHIENTGNDKDVEIDNLNNEMNNLQGDLSDLENERDNLKDECGDLEDKIKELQDENDSLRQEMDSLEKDYNNEIEDLLDNIENLEKKNEDSSKELEQYKDAMFAVEKENAELRANLIDKEWEYADLEDKYTHYMSTEHSQD